MGKAIVNIGDLTPLEIALSRIGTLETPGVGSNPEVLKYYADVGQGWVKDDDVAWCAAFVGSCLETAGIKSTRLLNARSYLTWGKPTTTPQVGDIVVFWRISPTSPYGHVAYFLREKNGVIWTIAGNENDSVSVMQHPADRVLGYRTY